MPSTQFIITTIAGALVGFGIGIWFALRFSGKKWVNTITKEKIFKDKLFN